MTDVSARDEFARLVEDIVGLYHDSREGFRQNVTRLTGAQEQIIAANPDDPTVNSIAMLDATRRHFYGKGELSDPNSRVRHVSTQGEFKARNAEDGPNVRLAGNLFTAALFNFWEDHYRALIAAELGHADKNTLKAPIFGDLRHLRNSIIHHLGVALPEVERCEKLKWFKEGDLIFITDDHFEQMIDEIRGYLSSLTAA